MEIVAVTLPGDPGSVETMVAVYAEEYARMGWPKARILATFRSPWYASAYGAWRALGEDRVRELVDEAVLPFAIPERRVGDA